MVIVITGASRGIGAATARLAAGRGYSVCVNYRSNRTGADVVVRDVERAGQRAVAIQGDVTIEDDVVRLFGTVDRELGPVAALVNNAGILETQTRVEHMDASRITRVFATNVTGAFICAREVAAEGIRVNGVRAGIIYTDIHASGGEPGRVDRLAPSLPMKRGGDPDEVARAILWLLSDEASYTTGSFIDVSGGR